MAAILGARTVADPVVLRSVIERLSRLAPETPRRWGSLTAHEMLCHLGDAEEMALRIRPRKKPVPRTPRPVVKLLALWSPVRWPHGWKTNPSQDPRRDGTRPSDFERDRARVVTGLEQLSVAAESVLEPAHGLFGTMSTRDWQRWAFKHADHHLRQFGV